MIHLRHRNIAWLTALGLLIGLGLVFESTLSLPAQLLLLTLYAGVFVFSSFEWGKQRETLLDFVRNRRLRAQMSDSARESAERARTRGGYVNPQLALLDLGVIATTMGGGGLEFRKTRSVSKDDDGVRPYVTLHASGHEIERNAIVRFEIDDHLGATIYVYETKAYMRGGELNVMADHQVPLAGNAAVDGTGDWELRIYVDGNLVGVQNFLLAPSISERNRRLSGQQGHAAPARQASATSAPRYTVVEEPPEPKQAKQPTTRLADLIAPPPADAGADSADARRAEAIRRRQGK